MTGSKSGGELRTPSPRDLSEAEKAPGEPEKVGVEPSRAGAHGIFRVPRVCQFRHPGAAP